MAGEGKNVLMTFAAVRTGLMRRREAAGVHGRDAKAQRVLLNGLDQQIFENFIANAERGPYSDYVSLQNALLVTAAKPHIMLKLANLKPGRTHSQSILAAQAQPHAPQTTTPDALRLDRLESIMVSMAQNLRGKAKAVCHGWSRQGQCAYGDKCRFAHPGPAAGTQPHAATTTARCKYHPLSKTHDTADCRDKPTTPGSHHQPPQHQQVNTISTGEPAKTINGYTFMFPTQHTLSHHLMATRGSPKVDMWCVDGAATTFATYDRSRCFNIKPCSIAIFGPNDEDTFTCTEMGDCYITTYDKDACTTSQMLATDVLISPNFPFHIFSEILAFEKHCTASKSLGSWQFYSPQNKPLFHASQRLRQGGGGHSDMRLYFIDDSVCATVCATITSPTSDPYFATPKSLSAPSLTTRDSNHFCRCLDESSQHLPGMLWAGEFPGIEISAAGGKGTSVPAVSVCTTVGAPAPKVNTAKNLAMLLELHLAHDHWNFEDIAAQYGLTLPNPSPKCWACLLSKPRKIPPDKFSTRQCARVCEGLAADAKGPMNTPTPEGFAYFFLIVCLYSHFYWVVLAKAQSDWDAIWPVFVKRQEARAGKDRCVSFILTDGHKVHSQKSVVTFNEDRGIETVSAAPYSQWQNPAEPGIQARSLKHI